ncbi:hypothetical protein, partial [Limnohabitans sp.]|uniref:hypothetical protein n=1 Tax=Limnohabitans sp. TaxID=1907725 RepID=UPI003340FA9B
MKAAHTTGTEEKGDFSSAGSTASECNTASSGESVGLLPLDTESDTEEDGCAEQPGIHEVAARSGAGHSSGDSKWDSLAVKGSTFQVSCVNITSFWSSLATIGGMHSDIIAVQEHGILERSREAAQAVAFQQGFTLVAGPLDETGHSGVAVLVRAPARAQEDPCRSEEGRSARDLGRLLIVRVDLPMGVQVAVISLYCWSGSSDRGLLQVRSSALIQAARLEAAVRKDALVLIATDLNGDMGDFEPLCSAITGGERWDLGALEHL